MEADVREEGSGVVVFVRRARALILTTVHACVTITNNTTNQIE